MTNTSALPPVASVVPPSAPPPPPRYAERDEARDARLRALLATRPPPRGLDLMDEHGPSFAMGALTAFLVLSIPLMLLWAVQPRSLHLTTFDDDCVSGAAVGKV
jgi:hypothetical protein